MLFTCALVALLQAARPAERAEFEPSDPPLVILPTGPPGAWDSSTIYGPCVLEVSGAYHLFYTGNFARDRGAPTKTMGIGYASSTDGKTWAKHGAGSVLAHPKYGRASSFAVFGEEGRWIAIYGIPGADFYPTTNLYLATAKAPQGPWTTAAEPILSMPSDSWCAAPFPMSLRVVEGEYWLYFAGLNRARGQSGIGLATARDLASWSLHNDPTTTTPAYSESDPILVPGAEDAWDGVALTGGDALLSERNGRLTWELFYVGYDRPITSRTPYDLPLWLGRATSQDGVHWTKDPSNPILETRETIWPLTRVLRHGNEYVFFHDTQGGVSGISRFTALRSG